MSLHTVIKEILINNPNQVPEIPKYITKNIKYELFDWQKEALQHFLYYQEYIKTEQDLTHLMFNMATGSGKTLIIVALIIYYYKQGYRNFLFFCSSN